MMRFEKISLRKKFLLLSSAIMVIFALALSTIYYWYMKKEVVEDALEKSELILQEVEAIRSYVIDELRPKMYELHGRDNFILEAMSTTYISISIMRRFQEEMEGYTYRRVSQNPRNPENASNLWEDQMFDWFEADPERFFWQGQVDSDNGSFFVSILPDYMGKACLRCHGAAKDAPGPMVDKYGKVRGFRFSEGDLAGLNSVSIPIAKPLSRLARITGMIFALTLGGSLLLLFVVNILFDKLVVSRLAWIVDSLEEGDKHSSTPAKSNGGDQPTQPTTADELDSLQDSFRHLNRYVRSARGGDELQPNFIGAYTITSPVTSGTMSWLYQGIHSNSGEEVLLKIPLNNLHGNPLYRACLQTELKIIQSFEHPSLPGVQQRLDDILVLSPLPGAGPIDIPNSYDKAERGTLFTRIFELIAYLHTNDIVHHDLRPGNFFIDKGFSPILVDLGLASWSRLPDTIFDSGVGPQGDFRFMAPEQLQGRRGDPRSDLYSLGVMLFLIYSGEFPHSGQPESVQAWLSEKERIEQRLSQQTRLPAGLVHIIKKAMAYETTARYQWVEDIRDDFTAFYR